MMKSIVPVVMAGVLGIYGLRIDYCRYSKHRD